MTLEQKFLELVKNQLGGIVVVAFYLIGDDFHLLVDFALRVAAVEHHVAKHVYRPRQLTLGYGGVVNGLLLAGVGVEIRANAFERVVYMPRVAPLRALEAHVLNEMRHAVLAGSFVARAGIHHIAAIGHSCWGWLENHFQPV